MSDLEFKRVYKFYDSVFALRNLTEQHLKISELPDLNDPFESNFISFPTGESRLSWKDSNERFWADKGLICFSEDWSNPVIWSHYAEKHRGLALGFDIPTKHLLKVEYRKKRLPFPGVLNRSMSQAIKLVQSSLTTKFKHWEYEKEYRVIVDLQEIDPVTGLYFKNFGDDLQLREVIIGANSKLTSNEIHRILPSTSNPKITTARLAFSDYRIVRQRKSGLQE